jgi:alpha-L-glutamate ligase-like protein
MFKLFSRIKKAGVLGMNRRNVDYIFKHNPRRHYPLLDNKLLTKSVLRQAGSPTPKTFFAVRYRADIEEALRLVRDLPAFVIKPARGLQGKGVMVIKDRRGGDYLSAGNRTITQDDMRMHLTFILSGMFSLSDTPDQAIVEEYVREHPDIHRIHGTNAVSDIRLIHYRSAPVMAMLRVPCSLSGGVANLHAGGIGLGIAMETGKTTFAIQKRQSIHAHPDTHLPLAGHALPEWTQLLAHIRPVNRLFHMDYIGVDVVVDRERGPMILEVNARPGLDIQLANRRGLLPVLCARDEELSNRGEK